MLTIEQYKEMQRKAAEFLKNHGIFITDEEVNNIEVVDHGFGYNQPIMIQILVYINTERYCAKELIFLPRQIIPEHKHPPVGSYIGKQETFRCRFGEVYLYVPGPPVRNPKAKLPKDKEQYFVVRNEIILKPGQQYTLPPNTFHWLQAGDEGAIVSEFSSKSIDEYDVFTDPQIKRITEIKP